MQVEHASLSVSGARTKRGDLTARLYPEKVFSHVYRADGRLLFYSIVDDLLRPDNVVLDLGAGRGQQAQGARGYLKKLIDFRGRCARVIGVDPDPVVLDNPYVDEGHVLGPDSRIPLPDASVDLIVSYAVLEHIADPEAVVREIYRVLKPGGWCCAWTPNKYGYVGLAARLVPHHLHTRIARAALPGDLRKEMDVFPVQYRLNTVSAIRRHFTANRFDDYSFTANGSPSYNFGSMMLARLWLLWMAIAPAFMRKTLYVFIRKRHRLTK